MQETTTTTDNEPTIPPVPAPLPWTKNRCYVPGLKEITHEGITFHVRVTDAQVMYSVTKEKGQSYKLTPATFARVWPIIQRENPFTLKPKEEIKNNT